MTLSNSRWKEQAAVRQFGAEKLTPFVHRVFRSGGALFRALGGCGAFLLRVSLYAKLRIRAKACYGKGIVV